MHKSKLALTCPPFFVQLSVSLALSTNSIVYVLLRKKSIYLVS